MKKALLFIMLLIGGINVAMAQAEIKFNKVTHNFGQFSKKSPVLHCVFAYENVGDAPLVINQAIGSCGCTVPEYTKEPVQPGQKGEIKVTYNGAGKRLGHFAKSITVHCNGKVEIVRLTIEGEMTEGEETDNKQ
ncbi:MAG: DUF1573 domain-containing protein [Prevotella sp.]|nr:DUF1573 domain-containing protein [Prevotella sp.]